MEITKGHIALVVASLIAGGIIGAGLRGCSIKEQPKPEPIVLHDTISVHDTLRIAGKTKTIYVTMTDTMVVRDTDTIHVEIPIEHKEYRDTFETDSSRIELGVAFSGYKAKIDSIDLNYRFSVEPQVVEKKRDWRQFVGIGVGVGYGASLVGQTVYAAPEVGVHVVYGWGFTWTK